MFSLDNGLRPQSEIGGGAIDLTLKFSLSLSLRLDMLVGECPLRAASVLPALALSLVNFHPIPSHPILLAFRLEWSCPLI